MCFCTTYFTVPLAHSPLISYFSQALCSPYLGNGSGNTRQQQSVSIHSTWKSLFRGYPTSTSRYRLPMLTIWPLTRDHRSFPAHAPTSILARVTWDAYKICMCRACEPRKGALYPLHVIRRHLRGVLRSMSQQTLLLTHVPENRTCWLPKWAAYPAALTLSLSLALARSLISFILRSMRKVAAYSPKTLVRYALFDPAHTPFSFRSKDLNKRHTLSSFHIVINFESPA